MFRGWRIVVWAKTENRFENAKPQALGLLLYATTTAQLLLHTLAVINLSMEFICWCASFISLLSSPTTTLFTFIQFCASNYTNSCCCCCCELVNYAHEKRDRNERVVTERRCHVRHSTYISQSHHRQMNNKFVRLSPSWFLLQSNDALCWLLWMGCCKYSPSWTLIWLF